MEDGSTARINELLEEYNNLKRTAGGLIYFITTPTGKSFSTQLEKIKRHYEDPRSPTIGNQAHIGTLEAVLPVVKKDIQQLSEDRGL